MAACATVEALDVLIAISAGYEGSAYYDYDEDYCYASSFEETELGDKAEPLLFVAGAGEETKIRYLAVAFDVTWDAETDSYAFQPDPSIRCVAFLDDETFIGTCYLEDRDCDFRFGREEEDSPSDEAVYRLVTTNCLVHEERGPFLVP